MKKIPYSATAANGKRVSNFVEASSSKEAVAILQAEGLADIRLQNDGLTAFHRPELEGLSKYELAKIADFEIRIRKGSNVFDVLIESTRTHWVFIVVALGLIYWGVSSPNDLALAAGGLIIAVIYGLTLLGYRHAARYNNLLQCEALGDRAQALALIEQLRPHMNTPDMRFDLACREAAIVAKNGSINGALNIVERFRAKFGETSPGLFESRLASVFHASGWYEEYVEHMRTAHSKSADSPVVVVDAALAEARLGDLDRALRLIDELNADHLPEYGLPFIDWVRGVVALRRNDDIALQHLKEAVSGLLEYGTNPAIWSSLGLCTAYYAVALSAVDPNAAKNMLDSVSQIVQAHADDSLLQLIAERVPGSRATEHG